MSLELGSRFRLPSGRLVEVVPDTEKILRLTNLLRPCHRCAAKIMLATECERIGCLVENHKGAFETTLDNGYPRILKEVENEP